MDSYAVEVLTISNEQEKWCLVRECKDFGMAMKTAREVNDHKAQVRILGAKTQPEFTGYPIELFSAQELHAYYLEIDNRI